LLILSAQERHDEELSGFKILAEAAQAELKDLQQRHERVLEALRDHREHRQDRDREGEDLNARKQQAELLSLKEGP